jgi:hypothetical protein
MPLEINPAEYLDLINTEIAREGDDVNARIEHIHEAWDKSPEARAIKNDIETAISHSKDPQMAGPDIIKMKFADQNAFIVPLVLLHRGWIKSYRDVVAYGIRIVMYLGLAILMGTVFLRLKTNQTDIQPFINAGQFFEKNRKSNKFHPKAQKTALFNIPEPYSLILVTKASHGTVCMYSIYRERRRGAGGAGEKQGAVDKLRKAVRQQEEEKAR